MLEPRHVVPRHDRRVFEYFARQRVRIRGLRTPREKREKHAEQRTSAPVEQIRVVEVDVHDAGERSPADQRSRHVPERVRRGNCAKEMARKKTYASRRLERRPALSLSEIRRPNPPRRAVDVPELGARFGDLEIGVPATSAEERGCDAELSEPPPLVQNPFTRCLVTISHKAIPPGRPSVIRCRPVGVMAERPAGRGFPSATEPQ